MDLNQPWVPGQERYSIPVSQVQEHSETKEKLSKAEVENYPLDAGWAVSSSRALW